MIAAFEYIQGRFFVRDDTLSDVQIEELKMLTAFTVSELRSNTKAFKKYAAEEGVITLAEFLEIPSIKINPLRDRLAACFGFAVGKELKEEVEVEIEGYKGFEALDVDNEEDSKKPKAASEENEDETDTALGEDKTDGEESPEADDSFDDVESGRSGGDKITFYDFMSVLSVFNCPGSREQKLQFLYKIQDMDGNGKVSRKDLLKYFERICALSSTAGHAEKLADHVLDEISSSQSADDREVSYDDFCRVVATGEFENKMRLHI